jgi:hypothetical protein
MEGPADPKALPMDASRVKPKFSLGDHVDAFLEDVLELFVRALRTVVLFSLNPKRAAAHLSRESGAGVTFVGPYTFLLIGCLFYSYFVGAWTATTHSDFTLAVWEVIKKGVREGFSLEGILIRSLPLVLGTSLAAAFAGVISRRSGPEVRTLFLYLYGLQGIGLLLFALSASALGFMFIRLTGSDDYIILLFFALGIALGVQAFRCLLLLTREDRKDSTVSRVLLYLAFPLLFFLPMPLLGYGLVRSGFTQQEGGRPPLERQVPAVRIMEAKWGEPDTSRLSVSLSAVVENRSKYTFVLEPKAAVLEIYFVPSDELNQMTIMHSYPHQKGTYSDSDLEVFSRCHVSMDEVQIEARPGEGTIHTLAPGGATIVRVAGHSDVTSALCYPEIDWNKKKHSQAQDSPKRVPTTLKELAEGRELIVRLSVRDPTLDESLTSDHYRVGLMKKVTPMESSASAPRH